MPTLVLALGCTGEVADVRGAIDPFDPPPGFCSDDRPVLGDVPLRRLSRVEYLNTVEDLLPNVAFAPPAIPEDSTEKGFENVARNLSAPPLLVERYELTASGIAEVVMASDDARAAVLPCERLTTAEEQESCARAFLRTFGMRAFRRPLTDAETARYLAFIQEKAAAIDFQAAIELTIAALMQAPQFSYRVELGGDGVVDPYEMASRLSYLLWQSMPDDALFAAAAAGELRTEAQLRAQAERMLDEPRARTAMIDFHRQWLDFDLMLEEGKDPTTFPDWTDALSQAAREEADRFVEHVMFDGTATLNELFTSPTTYVNGPLAAHYGVDPVDDWTRVDLPTDERSGFLTRTNFLAGHAHAGNGSPVLRGVFVVDRLLCVELGAPPADADTSEPEPDPDGAPKTNRMLFEERTEPGQCQGCHLRIDGIGFGFENYDSTGAFRTRDNTLPVDASGELFNTDVDGTFEGGIELSARLAESGTVRQCVTANWLRYTLGRPPVGDDACLLQRAERSLEASGGNIRELLISIVTSPEFARGIR